MAAMSDRGKLISHPGYPRQVELNLLRMDTIYDKSPGDCTRFCCAGNQSKWPCAQSVHRHARRYT